MTHQHSIHPTTLPPDVDPWRACTHRPAQTYTHDPCSCGRPLWPPRGRGRGESLTSARRLAAQERALTVMRLRARGFTYEAIARRLGFADKSGAWRAERRMWRLAVAWSQSRPSHP